MTEPNILAHKMSDAFRREALFRDLDNEKDPDKLRKAAKNLVELWLLEKTGKDWALREAMSAAPRFDVLTPSQELP